MEQTRKRKKLGSAEMESQSSSCSTGSFDRATLDPLISHLAQVCGREYNYCCSTFESEDARRTA